MTTIPMYTGLIPYDPQGHMIRKIRAKHRQVDWRPAEPLLATLALWGTNLEYREVFNLIDVVTGVIYPISYHAFLRLGRYKKRIKVPRPETVQETWGKVLENADHLPGPRPEGCTLPTSANYWRYSWTGTWRITRHGSAYGLDLFERVHV